MFFWDGDVGREEWGGLGERGEELRVISVSFGETRLMNMCV